MKMPYLFHKNPHFQVLERGWLSSNSIIFTQGEVCAVVDTGYCSHAPQTLALLDAALQGRALDKIINTHLHSDHCGGNAALQNHYPNVQTLIPPGHANEVAAWDENALSYTPTGQSCPRFSFTSTLLPDTNIQLGDQLWQIHAAPGHDPHSVILFEPTSGTLISADALWENGFGVVFPELEGEQAFHEVAQTLDLIERLNPQRIIPGHGSPFTDLAAALKRARSRLAQFQTSPERHATYAAKVLIKYKLLEWQRISLLDLFAWVENTPYFSLILQRYFEPSSFEDWLESLLTDLSRSGAAQIETGFVLNR